MSNTKVVYDQNRQVILELIVQAGFSNLKDFSQRSNIPMLQISRLLYGLLPKINLEIVLDFSRSLQIPLHQLLILFYPREEISTTLIEQLESLNSYQEIEKTLESEREAHSSELLRLQQELESERKNWKIEQDKIVNQLEHQKQEALVDLATIQQQLQQVTETFYLQTEQMQANFALEKESLKSEYSQEIEREKKSLRADYEQLQNQLQQEKEGVKQEIQDSTLKTLESLLIQLPTITAAIQKTPDFPPVKLLPLFRPIAQLLKDWRIEPIGTVGVEMTYDPQYHQLLEGEAKVGDPVRVRYVGYKQDLKILYRAKVSPVL